MTGRNAMIHRTTILRDTQGQFDDAKDDWGGQLTTSFSATTESDEISCRYWYDAALTFMDGEKRIYSAMVYLMLPIDCDVTPLDKIGDIKNRRGKVLMEGPFRIDELGNHEVDHQIAMIVRVT